MTTSTEQDAATTAVDSSLASAQGNVIDIVLAATFTAEPIEQSLQFCFKTLHHSPTISFAPYNQVFQQLLDPMSVLGNNTGGLNIALIRIEDWQHETMSATDEQGPTLDSVAADKHTAEFISALENHRQFSAAPMMVVICPPSPARLNDTASRECLAATQQRIVDAIGAMSNTQVITPQDVQDQYSVTDYYDANRDAAGHIPFSDTMYVALAASITRRYYASKKPPHKVIVLDCDNTLWGGVVGEDGVNGIRVDGPFDAMQRFMIQQSEAGMLLCLCSKNNDDDVQAVFDGRPDMALKSEHIVSRRVNWMPKSQNIRELAEELSLGLDSFVFIDDNPVECAEVGSQCPEVLALRVPENTADIPAFIDHLWPLDHDRTTDEDRQRTRMYQQNIERKSLQSEVGNFAAFIESLNLQIQIDPVSLEQIERVAQLSQRTNQFNSTTVRRSEAELQAFLDEGGQCRTVTVQDRFGDYGLVGVLLYKHNAEAIVVDSFFLSCRVLGRGVEYGMIAHLGELANGLNLKRVDIPYVPTKKNVPIFNFLQKIGSDYEQLLSERYVFRFPVEVARTMTFESSREDTHGAQLGAKKTKDAQAIADESAGEQQTAPYLTQDDVHHVATRWTSAKAIQSLVSLDAQRDRPNLSSEYVMAPPDNDLMLELVGIWQSVLDVKPIGIEDDFFELGGDSLSAVQLLLEVEQVTGQKLSQHILFENATITKLATTLANQDVQLEMPAIYGIQKEGMKPPFFAVAPADGMGLIYTELSRCLGDDQPFYALNRKHLDFDQLDSVNIEGLAAYYIRLMHDVQPQGPYFLGGYCNGSYVAVEIARQLKAAGEDVALLVIFDFWYSKELPAEANAPTGFKGRLRALRKRDPRPLPIVLASLVARRVGGIFAGTSNTPTSIASKSNGTAQPSTQNSTSPPQLSEEQRAELAFQLQRRIQYREPKLWDGSLFILSAADRDNELFSDGWENVAQGEIEVEIVPGSHRTILQRPNVETLAEKLRMAIDKAQAE